MVLGRNEQVLVSYPRPGTEAVPSIQSLLGQNLSTARDGWSRFCAMPAVRERQAYLELRAAVMHVVQY